MTYQQKWILNFEQNRLNRKEPEWLAPLDICPRKRKALAWSLAEYQLGDGGGPCRLIANDADSYMATSDDTRTVTNSWFREEAEHSRLLGRAVERLNGEFVSDSFSMRQFQRVRKLLGAKFEMLVLLQVEIISTVYYKMIRKYCSDKPIADMCSLILRDEAGHIRYHRDRLTHDEPQDWSTCERLRFFTLGHACGAFLWIGHGPSLRTLGMKNGEFFRHIHLGLRRFLQSITRTGKDIP